MKFRWGWGGIVEDIWVFNIVMDNVMCLFILNFYYFCGLWGKELYVWEKMVYLIDEWILVFRRIYFLNIMVRNVYVFVGFIYGLVE